MSVRIRLKRMGAKKAPFYRVVVSDARSSRSGKYVDQIGYYDPTVNPSIIKLDEEKAVKWVKNGAQPSTTVKKLFGIAGINEKLAK